MLAMECPTSMTNAEPFPAANLDTVLREGDNNASEAVRVQDARVGNVECGDLEFFEHDFGHSFSIGCGVPGGFGHENGMLGGVGAHDVGQRMRYQCGNGIEIEY